MWILNCFYKKRKEKIARPRAKLWHRWSLNSVTSASPSACLSLFFAATSPPHVAYTGLHSGSQPATKWLIIKMLPEKMFTWPLLGMYLHFVVNFYFDILKAYKVKKIIQITQWFTLNQAPIVYTFPCFIICLLSLFVCVYVYIFLNHLRICYRHHASLWLNTSIYIF